VGFYYNIIKDSNCLGKPIGMAIRMFKDNNIVVDGRDVTFTIHSLQIEREV